MKIKEITGLLLNKRDPTFGTYGTVNEGFNDCIDIQGEREIWFDRERLATILYLAKCDPHSLSLTDTDKVMIMEEAYRESDALIAAEKELIVFKEGK